MRAKYFTGVVACLVAAYTPAWAQSGDKAGEAQVSRVPADKIPPSPVLSAAESIKSFVLPAGFHVEIVAEEPLVKDPVAMQFDGDGRLYVVEMSGYMRNPEGTGETEPVGSVVVLEDTDGDGRMDKRRVFADKLVMPRALCLVKDGILIAEPPKLWFYPINGDGSAGEREEVAGDYAKENDPTRGKQSNPEHASNGLMWAMDNWIYSANHTTRFRQIDGVWKREPTIFRGQWGISQDDYGRLVYNSNSDQLRIDLVPSAYYARNPNLRSPFGLNVDPVKNQKTYPIRVTPGVNRGYQPGTLREDGKLAQFTAACGPVIYRGNNFPADYHGNAFVAEPSANLIKRNILTEENGIVTGKQAWDDREFLASTDERFRPVNLYNGPDGCLYIVDFYRGIIQHRIYLTSYLRQQMESRNMQGPTGMGRIYRVVHDGGTREKAPKLEKAKSQQLVEALSSENGWTRDTAQRLLVQRNDARIVPQIIESIASSPNPLARLHAIWTLDGMGTTNGAARSKAMKDRNPKVRAAAARLSDSFLSWLTTPFRFDGPVHERLALVKDRDGDVQVQLALSLGAYDDDESMEGMLTIAQQSGGNPLIRDALLSGLWKREADFLNKFLARSQGRPVTSADTSILVGLVKCIMNSSKAAQVGPMLASAAKVEASRQEILLGAMAAMVPVAQPGKPAPNIRAVVFKEEPSGFLALEKSGSATVVESVQKIRKLITWPGQPGYVPPPVIVPLTAAEKERFEAGRALFEMACAACHQKTGIGMEGLAPPLAESEWVNGPAERPMRVVMHGVRGRLQVSGREWNLEMPSLATLEDEQIAAILTYVRREWDNTGSPVTAEQVKAVRAATASRTEAWTEAELSQIK